MPTFEELQAAGGVPVAPAGAMTLEQLQAQGGTPVEEQAPEEPGRLEALGRGVLQGASLGFADEAQGALESIFTDKTYQQARDAARAANARAQAAHGGFYGAGEIGGGIASAFVPGLNIAEGAGLGTVAAKSALAGGLGGLGGSEATSVEGLAKDVGAGALEGGVGGAVAHGVGQTLSKALGGADAAETRQAVKGIAAGEGKVPGASMSNVRKLTEHGAVPDLLHEPVNGTTLAREAYKSAEEVAPLVEAKKAEIGKGLDEIYDRADKTSGGVKVSDLVKHYDAEIEKLSSSPGNTGAIKALEATRDDVVKSWAPKAPVFDPDAKVSGIGQFDGMKAGDAIGLLEKTKSSLETAGRSKTGAELLFGVKPDADVGAMAAKRLADIKDTIARIRAAASHEEHPLDTLIPSKDVRAFATTLQNRGSTNEVNPALATQIRQKLGAVTKDFVNGHVESVLGGEDRAALEGLNARMSAAYTVGHALEDRAAKEAGGKVSNVGALSNLLHGGGMVAAGMSALHGNLPGAAAALLLPKAIEAAPKLGRYATTQAAKANQVLEQIVAAAKQGSPWAQAQVNALRRTPIGAARLAQVIGQTVAAPVDQGAAEAQ